jgi:thiol-disulfide isomerase/thioredoxin
MTDRSLRLAIVTACVGVISFQLWAKPRPSAEEIRDHARGFTSANEWRERLAPDFELTLLDGSTFRLADHIGRHVVVLNAFATWCGPCRAEMPELERFANSQKEAGLILLGIDAEEKHTIVERFVADLKITFPIGIDASGDLLRMYEVSSYPTTIVIGADGRVKLYEVGAISNADVALGPVVAPELAAIREGRGISVDAYREALARDPSKPAGSATPLQGRGRRIAEAMPCPCGCSDKVYACGCRTAKSVKERLAQGGYDSKTDAEVMQELNKEFCMKGM